jgi:hypothetical protein
VPGAFADRDQFGIVARERQKFVAGEIVIQDHVGGAQPLHRAQRQQVDIAGTAADQSDLAE